ncbi:hypothetical protein HN51_012602 [Arachis hypogaea]|uniref:Uncharacterized protein LOC107479933 n=2 Tax=Arachis TaxID=3817 RepID=A0A6P4CRG7_ARADU|nr:uncharacterized protein LOC107479933 [Arachis duranensis]XP_015955532.1 uncharacterized protein LOC107479933 [Arachis duranensis]XP_025689286.1 uncharacterized protein LOC112790887 [Arachis hypogaea]XP_025689287.1 uncharacterized protein LOC112790887 [Arachis hypogaea]QHO58102.1 uncharacterized protein DS421_3g87880 [Arachis hypogaea]QHO58103.1 uncharacterized protein DS421_3g87880 [Arachis hypogaea]RYR66576.1 hypothetical protein Ahy_A03g012601 isoform A [Arachis hypogaea]RYR66577.1 hypo
MERRPSPLVDQTCTSRMFGIFNFLGGHFSRKLVFSARHLSRDGTDAGNTSNRSSSSELSAVDEMYPHIGVNSRRRDYGCKSVSCVENAQMAADQGNKVTKMTIDPKFVNKNYLSKQGAECQPDQLLDALQILYSNKELFLKLLQDPNSLLVKQISGLQSSQVNKYQNSNGRKSGKPVKSSFDRHDSGSNIELELRDKIVVLKPTTNKEKNSAATRFDSPWLHSHRSLIHNPQNAKFSHFPLCHIKRKLRYVMRARRKEQKTDGKPENDPCGCKFLQDGKILKELKSVGNSLETSPSIYEKRFKDSELCIGEEDASVSESCNRMTGDASVSPSEQNTLNMPVKDRKSLSVRRKEHLPNFESISSLQRYYNHGYITEGMRYLDNYQMDHRTKLGLQKERANGCSIRFLGHKNAPRDTIKTFSDKSKPFGTDIRTEESLPGGDLHAQSDNPRDDGYNDSPTLNLDKRNSTGEIEHFQDSHPEIQILSFPPKVVSSSPFSTERIEERTESVVEHSTLQPDEYLVQAVHEQIEDNHFAELVRSSLNGTNNLASSKDMLDCSREIVKVFGLKWDELVMKCESADMHDPSTFDELKGSMGQLSCNAILLDCVMQAFMEVYQNCGFPFNIARKNPHFQAYFAKKILAQEIAEVIKLHFVPHPSQITLDQLVGKDLERSESWLNIQVDIEHIVKEVEEDVLEDLVLEMVSEMDIRDLKTLHEHQTKHKGK